MVPRASSRPPKPTEAKKETSGDTKKQTSGGANKPATRESDKPTMDENEGESLDRRDRERDRERNRDRDREREREHDRDRERAREQEFLMRTLSKFGFGPDFCRWVSIFYNNVFSRIICNGKLTDPVFLGRGVRQGCPLSPLRYVLVVFAFQQSTLPADAPSLFTVPTFKPELRVKVLLLSLLLSKMVPRASSRPPQAN